MSETVVAPSNLPPNDPKMFNETLRKVVRLNIEHGYDAPAIEYTDENREQDETYCVNPPERKYWVNRWTPEYAAKQGVVNDSKLVMGTLGISEYSGDSTIVALGEGPSIKYGEYGSVSVNGGEPWKGITFRFRNDGVVMADEYETVEEYGEALVYYKPTRQVSDTELLGLYHALDEFEPYPKEEVA